MSLFMGRWMSTLLIDGDSFAAEWLQAMVVARPVGNPPHLPAVWGTAHHYRELTRVRAYTAAPLLTPDANVREVLRVLGQSRTPASHRVVRQRP